MTTIQTDILFDTPFIDWVQAQKKKQDPTADPNVDPNLRQNLFLLTGNNVVRGIRFHDNYTPSLSNIHGGSSPGSGPLLLGGNDITVTDNFFDDTYWGVGSYRSNQLTDRWLGIDPNAGVFGYKNVVITGNTFGAYYNAIGIYGAVEDSVISHNTFWPGAWEAPIALGVAGSRHLDISANTVDGTIQTYSGTGPAGGPTPNGTKYLGWRAGFFFPHLTSHEHLLIAGNKISCVGTRYGFDGEAIGTDSNLDRVGFKSGQGVTSVSPSGDEVTITPAVGEMYLSVEKGEYTGRWIRVDFGPGLGQTRKITRASMTPGADIQFTVSPPFDVLPAPRHSHIIVSQQSWQLYIVDNIIDNGCSTDLSTYTGVSDYTAGTSGLHYNNQGLIGLSASTVDSAIESNQQFKTAGIYVNTSYHANYRVGPCADCAPGDVVLTNNLPLSNLSGVMDSQTFYRLDVPPGAAYATFTTSGSTSASNDAALYVKASSHPTLTEYDCHSHQTGSNETCTININNPFAGPYYVMLVGSSAYSGVTLTGSYVFYSAQVNQYFVEVRGNTIEGSFGFDGPTNPNQPRPEDIYGSGIHLDTQAGMLDRNFQPQTTTDYMGFGVSVSLNNIKNAVLADPSSGPGGHDNPPYAAAVSVSIGGNWNIESPRTPGYVDTLVFGNTISKMPIPHPTQLGAPRTAYGILNGDGSPNSPLNTVICENRIDDVTHAFVEVLPPGQPSTLTVCRISR